MFTVATGTFATLALALAAFCFQQYLKKKGYIHDNGWFRGC